MSYRLFFSGALIVGLALPGALCAESLKGQVLDPQGGIVRNAKLRLFDRNSGEQRKTLSGKDGSYQFANLSAGDYFVEAEAADAALTGHQRVKVDGDVTLHLELAVSGAKVEIVVTASSTPLSLEENAKALDVVDAEELALRNEFSLGEAIRNLPGVRVQQLRGPGSLTTIQTRGLRTQDTSILIDGLRFRDAAGPQGDATSFYEDFTIVDTERIEFLRGSGSSLYGSHAMGGVLNVSSNQGGGRPHGDIRAEGGGLGMLRGVARAGGGLDDDRFAYSGGISHVNVTDGHRGGSPYRNNSGQAFAKYNLTPKMSLSGRFWGNDALLRTNESPSFPASVVANFPTNGPVAARALPNAELERIERGQPFNAGSATFVPDQIDPDSRQASSFVAAAVTLQHQLTPNSSYRVAYQLVDTNRSIGDGPAGPGIFDPAVSNESRFDGRTQTLQARTDNRVGRHHLFTVGYEFEEEEFLNFNTDEGPSPVTSRVDIDQSSHSIFAQDQIRALQGSLQVSLSGRAQFFSLGAPLFSGATNPYDTIPVDSPPGSFTGDAAVAYFVRGSQTKLRAHVGNSFRAPSLFERFGGSFSSFSGGFDFWGDPRLGPERSVAFDTGVDQWLYDSKVRLSATMFYTNLQEAIVFDFANFPLNDIFGRFGGYRSTSGGIARGAEFSARVTPTENTTFTTAYTYTNSDSRTPRIGADFFSVPGLSNHTFTFTATQWLSRRLNVTFDLFAVSDYSQSPFGAMGRRLVFDGPVKADVVFRYDIPLADTKTLELYGKVENVFDNQYYEDGFGSPGAWAVGGLRVRF